MQLALHVRASVIP